MARDGSGDIYSADYGAGREPLSAEAVLVEAHLALALNLNAEGRQVALGSWAIKARLRLEELGFPDMRLVLVTNMESIHPGPSRFEPGRRLYRIMRPSASPGLFDQRTTYLMRDGRIAGNETVDGKNDRGTIGLESIVADEEEYIGVMAALIRLSQ